MGAQASLDAAAAAAASPAAARRPRPPPAGAPTDTARAPRALRADRIRKGGCECDRLLEVPHGERRALGRAEREREHDAVLDLPPIEHARGERVDVDVVRGRGRRVRERVAPDARAAASSGS